MLTYFVAFLLAAGCSVVLTPLLRDLAIARGWVDTASEARKVHVVPTPRIGGVAIAAGFFLPVVGLFFWDNDVSQAYLGDKLRVLGLFGGSAIVVTLGLIDDLRGLRAWHKLVVQLAVAGLAYGLGYRIAIVANPFGDPVALGLLSLPITMLWIVGIMNAINLIDGLDGLAGGISLFSVLTLFVLGVMNLNIIVALSSVALAGALLGFLRYNFNPASVFMGDSGSLFLGYVLAITAISGSAKSSTVVSLLVPALALGLPMMDTLMAVFRRFIAGRSIMAADRGHVHHRLLDLGLTHRQAVLVMYAVCVSLGLGALALVYANSVETAVILGAFALATIALWRSLGYLSFGEVSTSLRYGLLRQRRLRSNLAEIETGGARIRAAATVDEALDHVVELARAVGADGCACRVAVTGPRGLVRHEARWPDPSALVPTTRRFTLEYPLDWSLHDVESTGQLTVWWECEDEVLQVPEAACYDWIAMLLRDRVLTLAIAARAVQYQPRLAEDPAS